MASSPVLPGPGGVEVLLEHLPMGVAVLDSDGVVRQINPAYCRLLELAAEAVVGHAFVDLLVNADEASVASVWEVVRGGAPQAELRLAHVTPEGRWRHVRCLMRTDPKFGAGTVLVFATDLTEADDVRSRFDEMVASEATFRQSLLGSAVPTALLDLNGVVTEANAAMEAHLATPRAVLMGSSLEPFMSLAVLRNYREQWPGFVARDDATLRVRGEWIDGTGRHMWADMSASLIERDAVSSHVVLQLIDVSAEQRAIDQLAYRSTHDSLTGLPNRAEVISSAQRASTHASRVGRFMAVLYLDLDNFKQINDGLSHEAGDEVLTAVASRLRSALRPADVVGRMGGDEFVVVLDDLREADEATAVAQALLEAVARSVSVRGASVMPTASIGVTTGQGTTDPRQMLREADDALRQAKRHGRNRWVVYTPAMSQSSLDRLRMEGQIREAMHERRIEAHFQPVVDLATGRLVGYEALARMRLISGGVSANAEFIEVAEKSGLIVDVGREVIRQAIETAARVDPDTTMAVNASGSQINAPSFADDLIAMIYGAGLDPRRLILEVTETTILNLAQWARVAIDRLVALGVGLHMDDFGTGFSSISHLRDLPVTGLKLDRSFTSELSSRASPSYRLAEGLASLAHSLRLTTIAEGVETPRQRELLAECGWKHGQGWLFGRAEELPG